MLMMICLIAAIHGQIDMEGELFVSRTPFHIERLVAISETRQLVLQGDESLYLVSVSDWIKTASLIGERHAFTLGDQNRIIDGLATDDTWCVSPAGDQIYIIQEDTLMRISVTDVSDRTSKNIESLPLGAYSLRCDETGKLFLYQTYVQVDPDHEELRVLLIDDHEKTVITDTKIRLEDVSQAAWSKVLNGFLIYAADEGGLYFFSPDQPGKLIARMDTEEVDLHGYSLGWQGRYLSVWLAGPDLNTMELRSVQLIREQFEWKTHRLNLNSCDDLVRHDSKDIVLCLREGDSGSMLHTVSLNSRVACSQDIPFESAGVGLMWLGDDVVSIGDGAIAFWKPACMRDA